MDKKTIRAHFKAQRKQLNPLTTKRLSKEIFKLLISDFELKNRVIHTFFSAKSLKEIEMSPINEFLFLNAKKVATSITQFTPLSLTHSEVNKTTSFTLDRYNIPIPKEVIPIEINEIDVVLIPLLAFDQNGNRLGYGKGLYDSFLKDCRSDCLKIGLSFFDVFSSEIPSEQHDIKLDYCITPYKIYAFNGL
ncbi:MAG: 5-formyltetrahydrofolate cyclo-ligase [Flavobacteriales bacterium]|jgi:5-formyltetrahydrofolate cyclo-ligase|nr:5-formyltetrahydrofolate cyclo-ligase [Flavobacteriales bacterium]